MNAQLHLARGIVEGRLHSTQDQAQLRTVELARQAVRRPRWARRVVAR